jgi:hypothetical protein
MEKSKSLSKFELIGKSGKISRKNELKKKDLNEIT